MGLREKENELAEEKGFCERGTQENLWRKPSDKVSESERAKTGEPKKRNLTCGQLIKEVKQEKDAQDSFFSALLKCGSLIICSL